jgi:hypothetical protein
MMTAGTAQVIGPADGKQVALGAIGARFMIDGEASGGGGPLSVEWEDIGMDREWGARDAAAFVRRNDFPASQSSFDVAFAEESHHG